MEVLKCSPVTTVPKNLSQVIDHSILRQDSRTIDALEGAYLASKLNFRALVTYPCFSRAVQDMFADTDSTVIAAVVCDFPQGRARTESRVKLVEDILKDGIEEIDIVSKYHLLLEGYPKVFKEDIKQIAKVMNGKLLKIILEVDYLSEDQIKEGTKLIGEVVKEEGLKNIVIKTKTGFAKENKVPNLDAVKIIKETLEKMGLYAGDISEIANGKIGIKASGGITTKEQALELLSAGAHILGTSSGKEIVTS